MTEAEAVALGSRADLVRAALSNKRKFGQIEITDVKYEVTRDSENMPSIVLFVTLKDPTGNSWPFKDVLKLRHEVWREADSIGLMVPVYLRLEPETDAPQEDDDQTLFAT